MAGYSDELARLLRKWQSATEGNPDEQAEMLERLVDGTATLIAFIADGQEDHMQTLLSGCEAHMYEVAATRARQAKLIAKLKEQSVRQPR